MKPPDNKRLVVKSVVGLTLLLAVAGLTGLLFREPISAGATWLYERLGLAGLFLGVLITDTSPLPLTHEPVLFLGVSAGEDPWRILAVTATASVLAGPVGWSCGRLARRSRRLTHWLQRRFPEVVTFMDEHGAKGVAIAALLPIPFAVSTWLAGLSTVRFGPLCAASLLRIPKTAFYLWLLVAGWSAGAP